MAALPRNDRWKLTPAEWRSLLVSAKSAMASRGSGVSGTMVLLDSRNECGQGHFIAPTQGNGYGYLDAVGSVFSPNWPSVVPSSIDTLPTISIIPQTLNADGSAT